MSNEETAYCLLCGRRIEHVDELRKKPSGYVCGECDTFRVAVLGESSGDIAPERKARDPAVTDEYQRHKVQIANQSTLRRQFQTSVADPKDPAEKQSAGEEQANGFRQHPILGDKVQFQGINENLKLPTMDMEQWENYLQFQLSLEQQKRLQQLNEDTMKPTLSS